MKDFTKFEKMWVTTFTLAIMLTTFYFSFTMTDYTSFESIMLNWIISPVSAITGIFCVVLCAKGKISTFTWGVINCITYGYVSYKSGVYGDTIINLLFFLPLQFVGLMVWKTKITGATVKSEFLKHPVLTFGGAIVAWVAFSNLLTSVDHWLSASMQKNSVFYDFMPNGTGVYLDASTEISQFFGQILLTIAKAEQWIFWIMVNFVSIFMWGCIIVADKTSWPYAVPTLIMWIAYLVNSFYGYSQWKNRAKVVETEEEKYA